MIASLVLVQATAITTIVRLVSRAWRLLGPLEAVAGMLMFGVSTAVLFGVTEALIRRRDGHGLR